MFAQKSNSSISNNEQLKHNMMEYKNDREKYLNDKKKNHLLRS